MAGSTLGNIFKITTWGESHGSGIGVVVDGCPAGLALNETDIQAFLDRRKPGASRFATQRKESDSVEILSGIFEGMTTGTPISMLVRNTSQKSSDYSDIASYYRPGHADYTFDQKYGFRDYRGGGRSSGRETIGRVAAGAIASKLLAELGITVTAYTQAIGGIEIPDTECSLEMMDINEARNNPTGMPDKETSLRAEAYLKQCMESLDSAGGIVACRVTNMPTGIGEPVFEKLDANLAKAIMSIGAVKAFEIGDGVKVSSANGSSNNDSFRMDDNKITKATNHAGGILGGISDGSEIILRAHFKPTPSIFQKQDTVNKNGENITVQIKGRHDPIIVPRAVVVVESMTAITILDLLLQNMTSRVDLIKKFYDK
ncbi:MAG: chorismate synthase [Lachnospiraceae bacterium]|nr:chorismate synthase [Lachnospiraceae bacterium]